MIKGMRFFRTAVGLLVGVILVTAIVLMVKYPVEYLRRLIIYQVSDVYDYQIFPERPIHPAAIPIPFIKSSNPETDQAKVMSWFEQDPLTGGDLDTFFNQTRSQALIVIQDNTILYERYASNLQRDSIVTSFSSAKSFVSTLVGIAIAEGNINSIDDPITRYLPELVERDPRFSNITIRHLLNMSSGIKYTETLFVTGDDALTYYYPDLHELALRRTSIAGEPGKTWLYNNYHPLLLGIILERATGMHVAKYMEIKLWQPMGAEYPASWSLDSEETAFEKMESGINARAIDFAKLGRLYLNEGNVNGQQILPAGWVERATRMDLVVDRATYYPAWVNQPYGQIYHQFLWWGVQQADGSYGYAAQGNYGQEIFVFPEKRLIIVRFGEAYGIKPEEWLALFLSFSKKVER